jgi:acetoin utilization deacetylase AcuC-like enzyme
MYLSIYIYKVLNRVIHVVGATTCASIDAMCHNQSRKSSTICGGAHHASYDIGSGYCVWNDIVIGAQALINEKLLKKKYLVIDLDVHQVSFIIYFKEIFLLLLLNFIIIIYITFDRVMELLV